MGAKSGSGVAADAGLDKASTASMAIDGAATTAAVRARKDRRLVDGLVSDMTVLLNKLSE
jgi:hypothetical protein